MCVCEGGPGLFFWISECCHSSSFHMLRFFAQHTREVAAQAVAPLTLLAAVLTPACAAPPPSPQVWYYIDVRDAVQGPFSGREMTGWVASGMLMEDTRACGADPGAGVSAAGGGVWRGMAVGRHAAPCWQRMLACLWRTHLDRLAPSAHCTRQLSQGTMSSTGRMSHVPPLLPPVAVTRPAVPHAHTVPGHS